MREGDVSAPVTGTNSLEHIEFEGPRLWPWPVEASGPFLYSLPPSPSAWEGSCYSGWFFRAHCTVRRDTVSEGNVHPQVLLLFYHLLLPGGAGSSCPCSCLGNWIWEAAPQKLLFLSLSTRMLRSDSGWAQSTLGD